MNGLVHPWSSAVDSRMAQRRRSEHSDRACENGCLIGENVAEHVLRHDHVECRRPEDDIHREGIDEAMLQLHAGKFVTNYSRRHFAPESRRLQDIRLVDRCHQSAPLESGTRSNSYDRRSLIRRVRCRIGGPLTTSGAAGDRLQLLLSEINPASELADKNDIRSGKYLRPER